MRVNHNTIALIRAYEDSVATPEDERLTYLDENNSIHLIAGDVKSVEEPFYRELAARCSEYLRFGYDVDALTSGMDFNPDELTRVCAVPLVFLTLGFKPGGLFLMNGTLTAAVSQKDALDLRCGGLSISQMKRLPKLLSSPAALFDGPVDSGSLLALLTEKDNDGLPLVVSLSPNEQGGCWLQGFVTPVIQSIYGKAGFQRYFSEHMTPDRLVYIGNVRGRELNVVAKRQLLCSHIVEHDLCGKIIRRPKCVVKEENAGHGGYSLSDAAQESRRSGVKLENMRPSADKDRNQPNGKNTR